MMWAFDVLPTKDDNGKDILPDPESLDTRFCVHAGAFPGNDSTKVTEEGGLGTACLGGGARSS